jgi:hypothetical protein
MAKTRKKFDKGIRLKEDDLSVATGTPLSEKGEIALDSTDSRLKMHDGSNTKVIVDQDSSEIIQNKTIDGTDATGNNTVKADATDITYDNASSGLTATTSQAAIDEVEGRVDTVETGLADHLADTVDSHDASSISNIPSGNLAATDIQGAVNELQTDIDTRALASDLTDHENETTGAHAASAISNTPSGNLVATDVQAALNELQTELDGAATSTELNDHITDATGAHAASAISNTPSGNLAATDVQAALNELQTDVDTRATSTDLSNHEADTSTHGVGTIVGTTETQTLTGKDIDGGTASNTSRITVPKAPKATLDGLTRKEGTIVYADDQDKAYIDNGTDLVPIGSGDGTGINYITNGTFELNVDDWTGDTNLTISQETSASVVLRGDGSLKIAKGAIDASTQSVTTPFTVDNADLASVLTIAFDIDASHANYADGDAQVRIIKVKILKVEKENILHSFKQMELKQTML